MSADAESPLEKLRVVGRPSEALHDLPVKYRWEATRRHPYYLGFWKSALRFRCGELRDEEAMLGRVAVLLLQAIGVTGLPVDPSIEFEELDASAPDPAFLSGAITPVSLRATIAMLINALPPKAREAIGSLLRTAGSDSYEIEGDDAERTEQRRRAIEQLASFTDPLLDSYPDVPLLYVHLGASQRTIIRDLATWLRRWKERRGIPERRVHTRKLGSYLHVWDFREGWGSDGYEPARALDFATIAAKSKLRPGTVVDRYRSAFRMITGHEFSLRVWQRLFAPLLLTLDPTATLPDSVRRRIGLPAIRPVAESVVSPAQDEGHKNGLVDQLSSQEGDIALVDLLLDTDELFNRGIPESEIAKQLGIDVGVIRHLRERMAEFRERIPE
jgi:hypothetical protein